MVLSPPIQMSLDDCLEYIADDELVEVNEFCFRGRHGHSEVFCKCSADMLRRSFIDDLAAGLQITPQSIRIRKNPMMAGKRK